MSSMKQSYRLLLLLGILSTTLWSACKRNDDLENPVSRLSRRWLLVNSATDDNGDGAIQQVEYHPVADGFVTYYTFADDNSGNESVTPPNGNVGNYPFKWKLTADTLLVERVGNNSNNYYVKRLSNLQMELLLETNRGPVGYYFEPK
jgi:hypothetical protein